MRHPLMTRTSVASVICVLLGWAPSSFGTSIVFPAFSAPIIHDGRAYFSYTSGKRVLCFDLSRKELAWKRDLDFLIARMDLSPEGEIVASGREQAVVLEPLTGQTVKPVAALGFTAEVDSQGHVYRLKDSRLECLASPSGPVIWHRDIEAKDSNAVSTVCGDWVFVSLSPRSIVSHSRGSRQIAAGKNELLILRARDGQVTWQQAVPLDHSGSGLWVKVKRGAGGLVCSTGTALYIIDEHTGKPIREYQVDEDIRCLDWWGASRLVLCLGNIGSRTKSIRVIHVEDLKPLAEFTISATEAARAEVADDMLIIRSLYRNYGVDLKAEEQVWQSGQRHETVFEGSIYYGEPAGTEGNRKRVFGVCDLKTGKATKLYEEPVEPTTRPSNP
jgi:hypothetical protein